MLIQGILYSILVAKHGKLKLINRAMIVKLLQDYMRQQSRGPKTNAETAAVHLTTFKNRASLLRVHKMLQDVHTNVCALNCHNLDRILSRLNSVHKKKF